MNFLKKLLKPKPWQELEKDFKLQLQCEACGLQTPVLFIGETLLRCLECEESRERKAKFLAKEAEWADLLKE